MHAHTKHTVSAQHRQPKAQRPARNSLRDARLYATDHSDQTSWWSGWDCDGQIKTGGTQTWPPARALRAKTEKLLGRFSKSKRERGKTKRKQALQFNRCAWNMACCTHSLDITQAAKANRMLHTDTYRDRDVVKLARLLKTTSLITSGRETQNNSFSNTAAKRKNRSTSFFMVLPLKPLI